MPSPRERVIRRSPWRRLCAGLSRALRRPPRSAPWAGDPVRDFKTLKVLMIRHVFTYALDDYEADVEVDGKPEWLAIGGDTGGVVAEIRGDRLHIFQGPLADEVTRQFREWKRECGQMPWNVEGAKVKGPVLIVKGRAATEEYLRKHTT